MLLQKFEVKPTYNARCMDWERMLAEFEWPHYSRVGPAANICLFLLRKVGPLMAAWQDGIA